MAYILQGRRARKYLGLAVSKLAELLRSSSEVASRTFSLPAGKLLLNKIGPLGRALIQVRDPYLTAFLRYRKAGVVGYELWFGGKTGEPFLPDLPVKVTHTGVRLGQAVLQPAGQATAIATYVIGDAFGGGTLGTAPYTTTRQTFVNVLFGVVNYQRGVNVMLNNAFACACNVVGDPLVQMEPLGAFSAEVVCTAAWFTFESEPGTNYSTILRFSRPATASDTHVYPEPEAIWPPASLNGGRPDLASIVSPITCYGRGKLAFVLAYQEDWRTVDDPQVTGTELAFLTEFGATLATLPLTTLDPTLSAYWAARDNRQVLSPLTGFAYSGQDHLSLVLALEDEFSAVSLERWRQLLGQPGVAGRGWRSHAIPRLR
jgi:hypothetical protein